MNNAEILTDLTLCGILGLVGQGIRLVVGLKKLQEEAAAEAAQDDQNAKRVYNQAFDTRQLWLSLLIGFIAGCLAKFSLEKNADFDTQVQLGIIAAGYAGTDFIEGVFKKILPNK